MEADRKEALRYLGFGQKPADERTEAILGECLKELKAAVRPGAAVREFPIRFLDGEKPGRKKRVLCDGCFETESESLLRNLSGCESVLLMAATLGMEADRLLMKYERISMAKAVVMQAAAAGMIEIYCNERCLEWKAEYEARGLFLRPRFSPGYGDFSLSSQAGILNALDAGKRPGIRLTDGGLMIPVKSVTAVIGISKSRGQCLVEGCEACRKKDCAYRR